MMSELADILRETTEAMASYASVDMDLWNRHSNACLQAAAALSVEQMQPGVGVKKLEWDPFGRAHSEVGTYEVVCIAQGGVFGLWRPIDEGSTFPNDEGSEKHCRAAAQADYEQRIRSALVDVQAVEQEPVATYFARQIEWSRETFGPALRTKGVIDHIRKELTEIEREPHDLSEWIDVVILAMDGFWRHGGKPHDLMPALLAKQQKNMARDWPDWRSMSEDSAIEHDRSNEAVLTVGDLHRAAAIRQKGEQP